MKKIAMKCSQEDWKQLKKKLNKKDCLSLFSDNKRYPYLVNYYGDGDSFGFGWWTCEKADEIHETFNAKIFLEACGIEFDEYKITKETIIKYQMKDEFPSLFNPYTGWAKANGIGNEKWIGYFENDEFKYGIGADGKWFERTGTIHRFKYIKPQYTEATPKEVEEALINYAKSKYKKGDRIKYDGYEGTIIGEIYWAFGAGLVSVLCDKKSTKRQNEYFPLMVNGVWSEILPNKKKMTISEIEEKYNIEVVRE